MREGSQISALLTPTSALPSRKFFGPFSVFPFFNSQEHFIPGFLNLQTPAIFASRFCIARIYLVYFRYSCSLFSDGVGPSAARPTSTEWAGSRGVGPVQFLVMNAPLHIVQYFHSFFSTYKFSLQRS